MKAKQKTPTTTQPTSRRLAFARGVWDRVGALASGLCLIHCLSLPAILLVVPGWTLIHPVEEILHVVLALSLLPVTLFALQHGSSCADGSYCRSSARFEVIQKGLLWMGVALVWLALPSQFIFGELAETGVTVAGSTCLIAGHSWRLYVAKRAEITTS